MKRANAVWQKEKKIEGKKTGGLVFITVRAFRPWLVETQKPEKSEGKERNEAGRSRRGRPKGRRDTAGSNCSCRQWSQKESENWRRGNKKGVT